VGGKIITLAQRVIVSTLTWACPASGASSFLIKFRAPESRSWVNAEVDGQSFFLSLLKVVNI
jgi:hypothetical protein